jgi:hypothetical protein
MNRRDLVVALCAGLIASFSGLVRIEWVRAHPWRPAALLGTTLLLGLYLTGTFDGILGLRGEDGRPQPGPGEEPGEPGPPPLDAAERLGYLLGPFGFFSFGPTPAPRELAPGLPVVDYVEACSTAPRREHERSSGAPLTLTVHTSEENVAEGFRAVCRYHSQTLGWGRAGYHFWIGQDGRIVQLLDLTTKPYAQKTHNDRDLSVVLQGQAGRNVPTEQQLSSLARLANHLFLQFPSIRQVMGHRDWTRRDQADPAMPDELKNDHTDPGPNWDASGYGLHGLLAAVRAPTNVPVPALAVRARQTGDATYYLPSGRPTASGQPYDGRAHTAAVWLIPPEAIPEDDPRRRFCRDSPGLGRAICPAYPFGTVLRVCLASEESRCTRVLVNDTGLMTGPALDLSPVAFKDLAPLGRGRLRVVFYPLNEVK